MKRIRLSNEIIHALDLDEKESEKTVWDSEILGLGIRVRRSTKTWILKAFVENRQVKQSLGRWPELSIKAARKKAAEQKTTIAAGGSSALPSVRTFSDLAKAYLDDYSKSNKKTWRQDERRLEGRLLPAWANRRLTSISTADVQRLHNRIGESAPYEANRVLNLVSKMFRLAAVWGWLPGGLRNPAEGIRKFKETRRDVWIRPEQMGDFVKALAEEEDILVRAGIMLYLLTGLRKMELLSRRWSDWDRERGLLAVPDNKASRPFYVPLSGPAQAVLSQIPAVAGSPWIFPGPDPRKHLADFPRRPWLRIRLRIGIDNLRIHDLRRTFGSWLTTSGSPLSHVAKALNQSSVSVTQAYAHLADDPVRAEIEHVGGLLEKSGIKI